jgi:hypothetical protein
MNQVLITHVCTELVVIGGLTFYFTRRHKESEKKIQELEQRVQELERKTGKQNSSEKHIQTLYEMIEGLEARITPEPVRANPPMGTNIRNRKSKMRVVELPPDEDPVEDAIPLETARVPASRPPSNGPSGLSSMFPMDALFGMISGQGISVNPMEILMSSSSSVPTQQSPPSVEIEEDDDSDIKDELHSLGIETLN